MDSNLYNNSITELKTLVANLDQDLQNILDDDSYVKCESHLDGWDYCYALAIGIAGIYITTSEKLNEYLSDIHKAASECNGEYDFFQKFLGRIFHHKGDHIDIVDKGFKNRSGDKAYVQFHRLLWGHDILSINEDNPFYLMFQQKGIKGVFQALRHLLADTLSKQGLPMPGSSFLDFKDENGKTSNYLISISQKLSDITYGNKSRAQDIYSHMFTIKGQDLSYAGIVDVLSLLYFKIRGINNSLRKSEVRFLAFSTSFWGKTIYGMIHQGGIPYISIPLAQAVIVERIKIGHLNSKVNHELSATTDALARKIVELENQEMFINEMIGTDFSSTDKRESRKRNLKRLEILANEGDI